MQLGEPCFCVEMEMGLEIKQNQPVIKQNKTKRLQRKNLRTGMLSHGI